MDRPTDCTMFLLNYGSAVRYGSFICLRRSGRISWLIPFQDCDNNFQSAFLPILGSRKLSNSEGTFGSFPKGVFVE